MRNGATTELVRKGMSGYRKKREAADVGDEASLQHSYSIEAMPLLLALHTNARDRVRRLIAWTVKCIAVFKKYPANKQMIAGASKLWCAQM